MNSSNGEIEGDGGTFFVKTKLNTDKLDPPYMDNVKKAPGTSQNRKPQKVTDCMIKLCPQDIYLNHNSAVVTCSNGTTKGTVSSQSSLITQHIGSIGQKPSTSGSSYRRPLSRNHPMLNLINKKQ